MLANEGLNDIVEDADFEWNDEVDRVDDDDDLEDLERELIADENDPKVNEDIIEGNPSNRVSTSKSLVSSTPSEIKRVRAQQKRQAVYNIPIVLLRRDPAVDAIIQTRKFSVIENSYTRLSQVALQGRRPSQRLSSFELRPTTTDRDNESKGRILSSQNKVVLMASSSSNWDNQELDEAISTDAPKDGSSFVDKSPLQLYEETCHRLSICPCSLVVRSIQTTTLNLYNYGLGPRGCIPLAAALARNTTIVSLNLSGNNIGSHGMSYIYQVLAENTFIEDYDLSFNNLGSEGIAKLAAAVPYSPQLKTLSVAGNKLTANDMKNFLSKLENNPNLSHLNISYNQLDDQGGNIVAEWLGENSSLLHLDVSWCCIRLSGAKAMAKAIGENNRLTSLDLSHNSFANDTLESFTHSFQRNVALCELNLRGNEFICRYDQTIKENKSLLITGKDSQLYKMLVAAATNQALKILRLGHNHIDARCLEILLEPLSKLANLSLEELDLTGLAIGARQLSIIERLFVNPCPMKCYLGAIRQSIEHFVNNLLDGIYAYCRETDLSLSDVFNPTEDIRHVVTSVTYDQFLDGLRRAKIPFPSAYINDVMKYLGRDSEPGTIAIRSLIV